MSEHVNETGCTVNVSHITGDIVCKVPGPECDCLITAHEPPPENPLGQWAAYRAMGLLKD